MVILSMALYIKKRKNIKKVPKIYTALRDKYIVKEDDKISALFKISQVPASFMYYFWRVIYRYCILDYTLLDRIGILYRVGCPVYVGISTSRNTYRLSNPNKRGPKPVDDGCWRWNAKGVKGSRISVYFKINNYYLGVALTNEGYMKTGLAIEYDQSVIDYNGYALAMQMIMGKAQYGSCEPYSKNDKEYYKSVRSFNDVSSIRQYYVSCNYHSSFRSARELYEGKVQPLNWEDVYHLTAWAEGFKPSYVKMSREVELEPGRDPEKDKDPKYYWNGKEYLTVEQWAEKTQSEILADIRKRKRLSRKSLT